MIFMWYHFEYVVNNSDPLLSFDQVRLLTYQFEFDTSCLDLSSLIVWCGQYRFSRLHFLWLFCGYPIWIVSTWKPMSVFEIRTRCKTKPLTTDCTGKRITPSYKLIACYETMVAFLKLSNTFKRPQWQLWSQTQFRKRERSTLLSTVCIN